MHSQPSNKGGYQSGQMGQTVNLLAFAFGGSNPSPPTLTLIFFTWKMKYLILTDIHGSFPALTKALSFFEEQQCDMLLILGDILNYGPRNRIPDGIDPKGIADKLNGMADKIVAIRGNCDSEVDQMLLQFPIMADYALVVENGTRLFLTHGHKYNKECLPPGKFDIVFSGHTHLWCLEHSAYGIYCNTGSITFPKGGNQPTLATYQEGSVTIYALDGTPLSKLSLK